VQDDGVRIVVVPLVSGGRGFHALTRSEFETNGLLVRLCGG
jgi:hypothetical protein